MLNCSSGERVPLNKRTDIRRVHASAQIEIEGDDIEETMLQRHPGASLKIMTPHQVAGLVFGLAGHEAVALDLAGQHVIMDEIHVYSDQSQAMVLAIVRSLVRIGCKVHVGSATIPAVLAKKIRSCLGGPEAVHEVGLTEEELQTYDRHTVVRLADESAARTYVREAIAESKRVLFIANRVASAQERYRWVRATFPDVPALLVHSRFRRLDRAHLEGAIQDYERMPAPCVVCSTQVVEVSLDVSFDTLVTDCAPLDALMQRFGRVNSWRKEAVDRVIASVGVVAPPANGRDAKPYDLDVLRRTWDALPDDALLRETSAQALIDEVYPELDMKEIEVHLVESDTEFRLPELCHLPRSVLLETLDIDTAAVIRSSDLDEYRMLKGEIRQQLEIPVSLRLLRPFMGVWRQESAGGRPFLCPDDRYDEHLGLLLGSEDEPTCIIL
jgi:CRISPR-associated endonuclease/helicase Cas3